MDVSTTLVVGALTLLVLATALAWWLRRRASFHSAVQQRGWRIETHGEDTVVVPVAGDWTLTMTRSFVAQMSPPSTHIVTSTWSCPTPATLGPVLVAGPAPPGELRELATGLISALPAPLADWLGLDRFSGGRPLRALPATFRSFFGDSSAKAKGSHTARGSHATPETALAQLEC